MLLSIIVDKADAPDIILERNPYEECSGASAASHDNLTVLLTGIL